MFEFETAMSRPSAHELHRRARRERARMVNAVVGSSARKLADWLSSLAARGAKLARALANERRLRRDIRTLRQFGDSALRDMGVARGEIEHVVRHGRPWHTMDWAGYSAASATARPRGSSGTTRSAA